MALPRSRFGLNSFENEVGSVNLTMRMRVRHAHCFALVLENQYVIDLGSSAEFAILVLPNFQQSFDRVWFEFRECQTVIRAVTNHSRDSCRRLVAINARRRLKCLRRIKADTGMIVIKDEGVRVVVVACAVNAEVTGTEIAVGYVFRQR